MADISKLDNISKLQSYEDYIANNITGWEAEIKALSQRIKTVRAKYNEIAEVTGISQEPKRLSVPKN